MQLQLNRIGDYTLRPMIYVACHRGERLNQARQIASEMQLEEERRFAG